MRSTPQRGLISSISGAFPGALEPPGLHGAYGYGACRYDRVGDVTGDVAAAAEIRPAAHVKELFEPDAADQGHDGCGRGEDKLAERLAEDYGHEREQAYRAVCEQERHLEHSFRY